MRLSRVIYYALMSLLFGAQAHAASGEYWEITSKMEMPGAPFAMPAHTAKVCVPKGDERNPTATMQDKDSQCEMADLKHSGNKTSWKVKCVRNGETMTGVGEATHEQDGYSGKMRLSGKADGRAIDMTQTYRGKRLGGACDTAQAAAQMKPAGAKLHMDKAREAAKKQECEGRGHIARGDLGKCLAGKEPEEPSDDSTAAAPAKPKAKKVTVMETVEPEPEPDAKPTESAAPASAGNPTVDDVLNTANKLKGLLRF